MRKSLDILGDFALIGNTFGRNCSDEAPVVGTITSCTDTFNDATPDVYWQADASSATAGPAITAAASRTTAVLSIPAGSVVEYAALYWFGTAQTADAICTLERPAGATLSVTALQTHTAVSNNPSAVKTENKTLTQFLSVADVTAFVAANGSGAYRVSGVDGPTLDDNHGAGERGWALVVFYEAAGSPPRNLVLFDGIDGVLAGTVSVPLAGFKVPSSFSGKLGVVGIDGEVAGASLRFGAPGSATALSDTLNPANFFFNGTRSWLGQAVSVAGDLPQSSGKANSGAGIDMDVVDITSKLSAGQTNAEAQIVAGTNDLITNFIWVTSITTIAPVLDVEKTVNDANGGQVLEGDTLEYVVTITNKGNDASAASVFEDVLDSGLTYVPGSLAVKSGTQTTTLTDAAGDDAGEWASTTKKLSVRLGTGATASTGGAIAASESVAVHFSAKVAVGTAGSTIKNQADVTAKGASGAASATSKSDDPTQPGLQSTDVTVATVFDAGVDGAAGAGGSGGAAGSGAVGGTGATGATGATGGSAGSGGSAVTGGSGGTGTTVGGSGGTAATAGGSTSGGKSGASDSGDDGGCGCRTARIPASTLAWLCALGLLGLFVARRRR